MGEVADDARLHDGADDDEESHEEEERRPFDGLQDLVHVLARHDHEYDRASKRVGRSLETHHAAEKEPQDRDTHDDAGDEHLAGVGNPLFLTYQPQCFLRSDTYP